MLCDHIITFRHTCLHVPIAILRSSRLGAERRVGSKIQALGHAECDFEIWPWEYTPLPISWINSMDRESAMQEQDGGTHAKVECGDGR